MNSCRWLPHYDNDTLANVRLSPYALGQNSIMDYNLDSLQSHNFEILTQSLLATIIGPHLTIFGDGPDGGREASWNGQSPTFGDKTNWNGYGVLQAKFKQRSGTPEVNLEWLKRTAKKELKEWARTNAKRQTKPDYLLFVTNVRLSSVPGKGKDEIHEFLKTTITELNLPIVESRVWDYYELRAQLDNSASIRRRYAAFLTTGDIIAKLVDDLDEIEMSFGQAIANYTARCLTEDSQVNLTQAGTAGDGRVTIADVFIDLPADLPAQDIEILDVPNEESSQRSPDSNSREIYETDEFDIFESRSGIARFLINDFNQVTKADSPEQSSQRRTVLIGGPGQGKSTVTQWLAQLYRAEFLKGSQLALDSNIQPTIIATEKRREELQLPAVTARRWPIRIILTELADFLATTPDRSLLHYISEKIAYGSSFEVSPRMLRKWLASYPCLLLIDGLDEVPSSSNRSQVLETIRNFFIETKSINADIFAVATTRPQGYSAEFSPDEYRHFQLEPLTVDEALDFAQGLVNARVGQGTAAELKVMKRLQIASQEEHTMKLFESPLQVTILEVLLEKLHKAPNDRSRLYSAYFNVISQREQEKSGPLSDLLQKYESDVNFLHRQIGYELQKRGAEVGETSSSLSKDEFDDFIKRRFEIQGHEPEIIEQLSHQFSSLVTDRLVFLAKLESEKIGFELRSLQEFMAGEYLVHQKETDVIPQIQQIAYSAYWRNVVLFAIGSIFSNKEHLRGEVSVLCNELNSEAELASFVLAGSDLAIDVLRDGSCLSMPRYARALANIAMRILDYPDLASIRSLSKLTRTEYSKIIWAEATSNVQASNSRWIGRATLLSILRPQDEPRAVQALQLLFDNAEPTLKKMLVNWARSISDPLLMSFIRDDITYVDPEIFPDEPSTRWNYIVRRESKSLPGWLIHISELSDMSGNLHNDMDETSQSSSFLTASATRLGRHQDAWAWLHSLDIDEPIWNFWRAIANFALNPSATSLADTLRVMKESDFSLPIATPWPLTACIRYAEYRSAGTPDVRTSQLGRLEELARNGELGDTEDWLSAQERWSDRVSIDETTLADTKCTFDTFSLTPDVSKAGIVPEAFYYTARHSGTTSDELNQIRLIEALMASSAEQPVWLELAYFVADLQLRIFTPSDDETITTINLLLANVPNLGDAVNMPLAWINSIPSKELVSSLDTLRTVGTIRTLRGTLRLNRAIEILRLALTSANGFPLLRIALFSRPQLIQDLTLEELESVLEGWDAELVGVLQPVRKLLDAEPEDIWQGEYDLELLTIVNDSTSQLGTAWFEQVLKVIPPAHARHIAVRGAYLVVDSDIVLFHDWLRSGRRLTKSMSIPSVQ